MTDSIQVEIAAAVRDWNASDHNLWSFAEKAEGIAGKRIEGAVLKLAEGIGRSADTVYSYAFAWKLFMRGLQYAPSQTETYRDELSIGHFVAVAKAWKRKEEPIALSDALNYLNRAAYEHLSVEALRNVLPRADGNGDWKRSAGRLARRIDREIIHAPRLDVDEKLSAKVARAGRLFVARVEKALEAE